MSREEFIKIASNKLKLVRVEYGYTQDKMAEILGISKKTLIQVEKERNLMSWTGAVALCTIFGDSEVINMTFGASQMDIIYSIAFNNYERKYNKTMGGKIWWKDLDSSKTHKIQQNLISKHYRILDKEDRRISSSFDYVYLKQRMKELSRNN